MANQGKKWSTALILSILLGNAGIDRFYLGYTGLGVLKLLTCVLLQRSSSAPAFK